MRRGWRTILRFELFAKVAEHIFEAVAADTVGDLRASLLQDAGTPRAGDGEIVGGGLPIFLHGSLPMAWQRCHGDFLPRPDALAPAKPYVEPPVKLP